MTERARRDELLGQIDTGWQELNRYLNSLSDADFTLHSDAAGWTVKDHVIHLAAWEDGVWAMLAGRSRYEQMGVDKAIWDGHDVDQINDAIYQRHKDLSLADVRKQSNAVHVRFVGAIYTLSDEDLQKPYSHYQPEYADWEDPVIKWIIANSYSHYREHLPWITAIVAG